MLRINLARLLVLLHRIGVDPRDVIVYWDDSSYTNYRRSQPRYPGMPLEPTDDLPEYGDEEED